MKLNNFSFLNILLILFFLSFNIIAIDGQGTIKGRIIDGDLETLYRARIYDSDTLLLGETDFEGYFEISLPKKSNKLIVGRIGYEWATISFLGNCEFVEIILIESINYHYKSHRKIDRQRKKRFKELSALHLKAVSKGVFINPLICFIRKFNPIKLRLDEIRKQRRILDKMIENEFQELVVGDTIRIPYSVTKNYDGTEKIALSSFSYLSGGNVFDCVIEGIIIDKKKSRNNYNLVYKVTNCDRCKYDSIILKEKI